jgi:hypothetical protein
MVRAKSGTSYGGENSEREDCSVADLARARYVRLLHEEGVYRIVLLDTDGSEVGQGYRGPTPKRAEQDLKYWLRDKGLEPAPEDQ